MSDYDGLDLALGTVRGFRRWKVEADGILKPMTYSGSGSWLPGENASTCKCTPKEAQLPKVDGEDWRERSARVDAWRAEASFLDMACGFYAYFDDEGEHGYGSSEPHVAGVIEGYGEVLIGTKGFRARRARIIALSVAPLNGIWRLDDFVVNKIRANYPDVPVFESELAMRAECPAPKYEAAIA